MIRDTELIENGQENAVTDDNMAEFQQLMLKHYLFDKIHPQLDDLNDWKANTICCKLQLVNLRFIKDGLSLSVSHKVDCWSIK